jgi:aspartate-semialdehyde dehydrogenase
VSGAGKEGMDELFTQTKAVFVTERVEVKKFTKRIAFNVIPHIDVFMEDGSTKEEWKVMAETKKILDPEDQGHLHLPCACRSSSGIRKRSTSSSRTRSRR